MNNRQSPNNQRQLYRYASLGSQILAGLALAVFVGIKLDRWLNTMPLFSCILPLGVLFGIFYRLVRETSGRRTRDSLKGTKDQPRGDGNSHYEPE